MYEVYGASVDCAQQDCDCMSSTCVLNLKLAEVKREELTIPMSWTPGIYTNIRGCMLSRRGADDRLRNGASSVSWRISLQSVCNKIVR